jgi:putative hydrolase of the HAD superfamily
MNIKDVESYLHPLSPIPTSLQMKGRLQQPIACLLFDIYGTLFISGSGDSDTLTQKTGPEKQLLNLFSTYGIRTAPAELIQQLSDRIGQEHDRMRSKGIAFPEVLIEQIWQKVLPHQPADMIREIAVRFELIVNPVWPMPFLDKLLSACKKAGLFMGIISNAQFYTPYLFNWFFLKNLQDLGFLPELVFYSYRFGEAKPSPRIFKAAEKQLRLLNIEPQQVVYIGNDVRNDIMPAQKVGFQTVLFAGDSRSLRLYENDPICNSIVSDLVVTDLEQLVLYLFA